MINNEPVKIGDYLYDILNHRGRVVGISDDVLEVIFDNGRRVAFTPTGYLSGTRRLFWQPPVLIDPPKDAERWEHIKNLIVAVNHFTVVV